MIHCWRTWETDVNKLRIGVVGLGGIAQKAWLPVLGTSADWTLQGAFSPSRDKAQRICDTWRIPYVDSLVNLAQTCDAVFVHSSTATHYAVVSELLNAGVHVCVDKPLAENLREAEQLVELAARKKLTLMVGFNRRFAPLYQDLKTQLSTAASVRMDKHRTDSVGPHDLRFTLLDDYLHVVDTALWLAGGQAQLNNGTLLTNESGAMLYAEHHFSTGQMQITTSMHRRAGSQRESVQAVTDGGLIDVTDMREWREERGQGVVHKPIAGWQTTLEQRGFAGCARHFIECVQNQTVPQTAGEQALLAQRVVEKLWREAMAE
nr:Gfo/Idh/MocA family oxidoreductase [Citrobacter freundii]